MTIDKHKVNPSRERRRVFRSESEINFYLILLLASLSCVGGDSPETFSLPPFATVAIYIHQIGPRSQLREPKWQGGCRDTLDMCVG